MIGTYDNEDLAFRMEFLGPATSGPSGNNRFDNIKVIGQPINTVDALLCEGQATFEYAGANYPAGLHLHFDPASFDCGHIVLVRVEEAQLDTAVISSGDTLVAIGSADTYQWIDCATTQLVSGANSAEFLPVGEGNYAVQLQAGDCIEISNCHYSAGDQGMGISVFPNPAQGTLFVGIGGLMHNASFQLIDATGRIVRTGDLITAFSAIDIRELSAGTYFIHVSAMDNGQEKRWTKVVLK